EAPWTRAGAPPGAADPRPEGGFEPSAGGRHEGFSPELVAGGCETLAPEPDWPEPDSPEGDTDRVAFGATTSPTAASSGREATTDWWSGESRVSQTVPVGCRRSTASVFPQAGAPGV